MFSRNTKCFVKLIYKTKTHKYWMQFNSSLIVLNDKICIIQYYMASFPLTAYE